MARQLLFIIGNHCKLNQDECMIDSNKKTLLLIMPPQPGLLDGFAAGLISLANFVESRMLVSNLSILDLSKHSFDSAKSKITQACCGNQGKPFFVGITTTTASYQSSIKIARIVKQISPQSIVILGGHHASSDPEVVLRSNKGTIDLIIAGEGERSLCVLIEHYPELTAVPSLCYLDTENRFIHNEQSTPLSQQELDSIPITYGDNGLIGTPGKFDHATYLSARGCPLSCAFCAVGHNTIRAKSIHSVIRDIELLLDMGFLRISIEDNFFAHSSSRTREICKALTEIKKRRNSAFLWDCQTRVESLSRKNTIDLMAKAGCEAVYIGVESFHHDQLLYLKKTRNPAKYLTTLTQVVIPALLNTDIECYLNLQFGLPEETENHDSTTLAILESLGQIAAAHDKTITIFPQLHVVYPGTAHFWQGVYQGRFPKEIFDKFTEWEFQQTPVLNWLGEYFSHGTGGIPEGIIMPGVLRNGSFCDAGNVVDINAIFRISAVLRAIDRITGVRIFNYGDYIVTKNQT